MTRPTFHPRWWPFLLVLPVLVTLVLHAGWGFEGLYNQDAYAYLRISRELARWWLEGEAYPTAYWPMGYPALGSLLALVLGDARWALLVVALAGWAALVAGFRRILLDQGAARTSASVFTLLTVGTSPFLLRHGVVVMSDVPAIALAVWSLRQGLLSGPRNALFAAVLATAAVCVRLPMAIWLAPMLVVTGVRTWHSSSAGHRGLLVLVTVVCGALVWTVVRSALDHPLGLEMQVSNLFRRAFVTVDGLHRFTVPNFLFVLKPLVHPGFLLFAPACWAFFRGWDLRVLHAPVIVASLLACQLFLGMLPDQNDRLCLPAVPLVALLLWPAYQRLVAWPSLQRAKPWVFPFLLVLQTLLFARAMAPFVKHDRTQRELAHWVVDRQAATVYTFGLDQALIGQGFTGDVVDLWRTEVTRFTPGALVLFNPVANAEQWRDRAPMRNWQRAIDQGVDTVGTRPDGWVLLRIR